MALITISNGELKVTVSTKGAELQAITDKNGVERLWNGDPAFWTGRAPVLFPIAGGLKDDQYTFDGATYPMPKHGTVRKSMWQVEKVGEDFVTFIITDKAPGFPFEYELRATYTLKGNAVEAAYSVTNRDSKRFAFSLGSHEAFATPEGIENYEIVFDKAEKLNQYPLLGNLIAREPVCLGDSVTVLPMKEEYFAVDAMVFADIASRKVTLQSKLHDRKVIVDFPQCGVLMLWTKPGAPYLCIEPWCNAPDFVDQDPDFAAKKGIMILNPGEEKTVTHTMAFA